MEKRDESRAKIEAKINNFNKTIEDLQKEEERKKDEFDLHRKEILENLRSEKLIVESKLSELDQTEDKDAWNEKMRELDAYVNDIDNKFRGGLATDTGYF